MKLFIFTSVIITCNIECCALCKIGNSSTGLVRVNNVLTSGRLYKDTFKYYFFGIWWLLLGRAGLARQKKSNL